VGVGVRVKGYGTFFRWIRSSSFSFYSQAPVLLLLSLRFLFSPLLSSPISSEWFWQCRCQSFVAIVPISFQAVDFCVTECCFTDCCYLDPLFLRK
jgi:hypothetical protein